MTRQEVDPLTLYGLSRTAASDHERQWAWSDFYERYMGLAIMWALRHPAFPHTNETPHVLAHDGFARLWRGTRGGETRFENSARLMAYLKCCVRAAVRDAAWRRMSWERYKETRDRLAAIAPSAESAACQELERDERRAWLLAQATTEAERAWLTDEVFTAVKPRHGAGARRAYRERDNYIRRLRRAGEAR